MRRARRSAIDPPRLEMFPLMDVVFLLLTFFLYSTLVAPKTKLLPVELTQASAGQASQVDQLHVVTLAANGQLFYNQQPSSLGDLKTTLEDLAQQAPKPVIYLAMATNEPVPGVLPGAGAGAGVVDRGPIWMRLLNACHEAGLDVQIVGQAE